MRTRWTGRLLAAAGLVAGLGLLAAEQAVEQAAVAGAAARAAGSVAVDWRVLIRPGADPGAVLDLLRADPGTSAAVPVGIGEAGGLSAGARVDGPALVVGLPDDYRTLFPDELRGAPGRVLIGTDTARRLRVGPGDTVTMDLLGGEVTALRVDGIVEPAPGGALATELARIRPDGLLVVLPEARWHDLFAALAGSRLADLVHPEVHVARSDDPVHGVDPAAATRIEAGSGGAAVVVDDLGAALAAARGESAGVRALVAFLPLPGAVLAGGLVAAGRRRPGSLGAGPAAGLAVGLAVTAALTAAVAGPADPLGLVWLVGGTAVGPAVAVLVARRVATGRPGAA